MKKTPRKQRNGLVKVGKNIQTTGYNGAHTVYTKK
jgi:hypothetical protein